MDCSDSNRWLHAYVTPHPTITPHTHLFKYVRTNHPTPYAFFLAQFAGAPSTQQTNYNLLLKMHRYMNVAFVYDMTIVVVCMRLCVRITCDYINVNLMHIAQTCVYA